MDGREGEESSEIEEGMPLALSGIGCTLVFWRQVKTHDLRNDKSFTVEDHSNDLSVCREEALWFVLRLAQVHVQRRGRFTGRNWLKISWRSAKCDTLG